ncbi:MAG: DUF1826 domain-containing protein [Pseudomonadota bacterium]
MSLVREIVSDAAIGVGVCDRPDGLAAITHSGCAATIWRRSRPPEDQAWIDGLPGDHLPSIRQILEAGQVRVAAERACGDAGTPICPAQARLVDDIAMLSERFSEIVPSPYLRLRLDVIRSNLCRKFHIDTVRARLICTYRGTGTQYGISTDGGDPTRVFTVPTGAPILLKGTLWPDAHKSGLLHRSPPIEGTGETRLLLVLDPIFDLEDEF